MHYNYPFETTALPSSPLKSRPPVVKLTCKSVQELHISYNAHMSGSSLAKVAQHCSGLRGLHLRYLPKLSGSALAPLIALQVRRLDARAVAISCGSGHMSSAPYMYATFTD